MSESLLPSGSTPLERATSLVMAESTALPVPIRALWNPDTCPEPLLPYLAWAFSVDRWDMHWPEATKRQVIKAAFFVHKHKGTIGALRRVVEPLGYLIKVIEWWQENPLGPRGTFRLEVGVLDTGITDAMYQELERLVDDAKPVSRHLLGLAISMETRGRINLGAAVFFGEELTVYPYTPDELTVSGIYGLSGSSHMIETTTIYQGSH